MERIRPPAFSGAFYPAYRDQLLSLVLSHIGNQIRDYRVPKALIVPDGSYVYSGRATGEAYSLLQPLYEQVKRVVVMAPTQHAEMNGIAVTSANAFRTPLGEVRLDQVASLQILMLPDVVINDRAHLLEHGIEVHLPFLQVVLGTFKLVPLLVGRTTSEAVADVVDKLWGDPGTLFVVSAPREESQAPKFRLQIDGLANSESRKGLVAVKALLRHARRKNLETVRVATSSAKGDHLDGQVASELGAFALYE